MEVNNADQAEVWFNAFLEAYINTALSLTTGGGTRSQIMPAALAEIFEDCDAFVDSNWEALKNLAPEACGADFFLTRNGHGAGFWDRGLGTVGRDLTLDAKVYSTQGLTPCNGLLALHH